MNDDAILPVLYVEDEPDIRALMEIAVEGEGIELFAFSSGADALASAATIEPRLILLDVMMPGLDGPETLRRLREYPHLRDVPAAFMTAKAQTHEQADYLKCGALGVIVKPFDPTQLCQHIQDIWETRNAA